ncbi:MAG: hypothetical protein AAFY28_20670 [Actinomycetota bacterium]
MALGLVAGLLVSVAIAADDDSGSVEAASPISDNFTSENYSGGIGWPAGASWTETNDSTATPIFETGDIQLLSPDRDSLFFDNLDNRTIQRDVDLQAFNPANGGTGAKVSFDFVDSAGTSGDDTPEFDLRFWNGSSYVDIATVGRPPNGTTLSYILPDAVLIQGSSIQIGAGSGNWGNDDDRVIDNIIIEDAVGNNDLADTCGVDIQVVLDESGSIYQFSNGGARGEVGVRDGVLAFLDGLNGTGSRINTHEFSNNGRDVELDPDGNGTFDPGYFPINDATIEAFLDDSGAPVTGYFKEVGTDASPVDSTDPETYEPRNDDDDIVDAEFEDLDDNKRA